MKHCVQTESAHNEYLRKFVPKSLPTSVILNVVKDLLLNQAEADPSLSLRMTIGRRQHGIFITANHLIGAKKPG